MLVLAAVLSLGIVAGLVASEYKSEVDTQVTYDYVIILGAGLDKDSVSERLKGRLDKGIEFLKSDDSIPVILSGGQGPDEYMSEAGAMGEYLIEHGISGDRIIYEDKSTSTYENFLFSSKYVLNNEKNEVPNLLIITSDYHMYRAKMIGRSYGYNCYGISSESPRDFRTKSTFREVFALVKDFIKVNLN